MSVGLELHLTHAVSITFDVDLQIGPWQDAGRLVRPFHQLETRARKNVSKARVFPLPWVAEPVEIEMPRVELRQFIGFYHGVGGAFDPTGHTQDL